MPQWESGRTADFYDVGLSSWTLGFESHHTCKSAPPDPSNSLMLPKEEDCFTESKSVLSVVKKEKKNPIYFATVRHCKTILNDLNLTSDPSSFEDAAKDRGSCFTEIGSDHVLTWGLDLSAHL